jgi:hypothetical protein
MMNRSVGALCVLAVITGCGAQPGSHTTNRTTVSEHIMEHHEVPGDEQQTPISSEIGRGPGLANACPVDGCVINIARAEKSGAELRVFLAANFDPSVSKNHFHIYWNRWQADQVSNDAESLRGVEQGEWVPTDVSHGFVTQGAVSVKLRGTSHTLCVTAGDHNHNVIDSSIVDCRDVSGLLK